MNENQILLPWKELEGKPIIVDVNSSLADAKSDACPFKIYFTTDKHILLNGLEYGSGSLSGGVGIIKISELDYTAEQIKTYIGSAANSLKTVVTDTSPNYVVGVLEQYSDDMHHVYTQVLHTHLLPPKGESQQLDMAGHNHHSKHSLKRSFVLSGNYSLQDCLGRSVGMENPQRWLTDNLGITKPFSFVNGNYYLPMQWTPWRSIEIERVNIIKQQEKEIALYKDLLTLA